jgi:hypothetical protein
VGSTTPGEVGRPNEPVTPAIYVFPAESTVIAVTMLGLRPASEKFALLARGAAICVEKKKPGGSGWLAAAITVTSGAIKR